MHVLKKEMYMFELHIISTFFPKFPDYLFLYSKLMHSSIDVMGKPLYRSVKSLRIKFEPDK